MENTVQAKFVRSMKTFQRSTWGMDLSHPHLETQCLPIQLVPGPLKYAVTVLLSIVIQSIDAISVKRLHWLSYTHLVTLYFNVTHCSIWVYSNAHDSLFKHWLWEWLMSKYWYLLLFSCVWCYFGSTPHMGIPVEWSAVNIAKYKHINHVSLTQELTVNPFSAELFLPNWLHGWQRVNAVFHTP